MTWQLHESRDWTPPLEFAAHHAREDMALLYSGLREQFSGRYSYLFLSPCETIHGSDWDAWPAAEKQDDGLPLWVGYIGYEMGDDVLKAAPVPLQPPLFRFTRYAHMFRFDHEKRKIEVFTTNHAFDLQTATKTRPRSTEISIAKLSSNFTRASYEASVAATIERIKAGDFYQANITRKFFGEFAQTQDPWEIFTKLCAASPAPYAAYIKQGDQAILSSSPEGFLSIDSQGRMVTRPIKGSARRDADPARDLAIQETLRGSEKNLAENLMIVDLMRNDLARVSDPNSVKMIEQSQLYSYATIHHLISTVEAQKRADTSVVEAIRACFPPGSMTGAPKIAAIRWCASQENMARGIYSGALGWLGGGSTCELSVVIRTLLIQGKQFEFQVGGGIVADSTPTDEWRETIAKARGIMAALGIEEEDLVKL